MDPLRLRTMPSTGLLLASLAAVIFVAAELYAAPHPHASDQIPGLTYEAERGTGRPAVALVVTSVEDSGPAARAGIATGDVIDRIDGRPIASTAAVGKALRRDVKSGVTLRVRHAGQNRYKHLPAARGRKPGVSHGAKDTGGRG